MKFGYSMPSVSTLYIPPPYSYKDNLGINILFKTAPETLHEFVPPPLLPNPDNLVFLYVGDFNVDSPVKFKYKEAGIGVPVLYQGHAGNYFVFLYLDHAGAIVAGREIWGFPKKDALIKFDVIEGIYQASVIRDGVEIIRASVKTSEQVKPIPPQAEVPLLNLKIIPSVRKDHPPDVLQLTSAGSSSVRKESFRGEATLSFTSTPYDLLGNIPVLGIVGGEQYVEDMILDCGEVLVDYLHEDESE